MGKPMEALPFMPDHDLPSIRVLEPPSAFYHLCSGPTHPSYPLPTPWHHAIAPSRPPSRVASTETSLWNTLCREGSVTGEHLPGLPGETLGRSMMTSRRTGGVYLGVSGWPRMSLLLEEFGFSGCKKRNCLSVRKLLVMYKASSNPVMSLLKVNM